MSSPARAYMGLILVLLLALWLRLPFISTGIPYLYHEDEAHHFNRVVEMVKKGTFDPEYFHKPSVHFYLRMPVVAASFLWAVNKGEIRTIDEIETRDPFGLAGYSFSSSHPTILKWNRGLSVLLSLASILLVYIITLQLGFSSRAGLAASTLSAVSPDLVSYSATIGVDIPLTTLCLGAIAYILHIRTQISPAKLLLAGALCGLAISTKYNAAPIGLLPLILIGLNRNFSILNFMSAVVGPVLGFLVGSPFILAHLPLFLNQVAYEIWHYGIAGHVGHMGEPGWPQVLFYLDWLFESALGQVAFVFALLGFIRFLIRSEERPVAILAFAFPILFFALMSEQKANFTRNMLVFVPFAGIFAAIGIERLIHWLQIRSAFLRHTFCHSLFWGALGLAAIFPLSGSVTLRNEAKSDQDTRLEAESWLVKNSTPGIDTSVSGELQFSHTTRNLPGLSRASESSLNAVNLYQSGFSQVILAEAPADLVSFSLQAEFKGRTGPQRVPKDPNVLIYKISESPELLLKVKNGALQNPTMRIVNNDTNSCLTQNSGADQVEAHCWLMTRLNRIEFSPEMMVEARRSFPKSLSVTLEAMSPWQDQAVEAQTAGWSSEKRKLTPGTWQELKFEIPFENLETESGFFIHIDQVHSPATRKLSADRRRLGLAVRNVRIAQN